MADNAWMVSFLFFKKKLLSLLSITFDYFVRNKLQFKYRVQKNTDHLTNTDLR